MEIESVTAKFVMRWTYNEENDAVKVMGSHRRGRTSFTFPLPVMGKIRSD